MGLKGFFYYFTLFLLSCVKSVINAKLIVCFINKIDGDRRGFVGNKVYNKENRKKISFFFSVIYYFEVDFNKIQIFS